MYLKNGQFWAILLIAAGMLLPPFSFAINYTSMDSSLPLSQNRIIEDLGWIETGENRCGGYYVDAPFQFPEDLEKNKLIITSNQFLFARKGTSYGQGKVTISRYGQQIIANKAYIYRDPTTGEIRSIELQDNVTLREPNSLIIARQGSYDLKSKAQSLHGILYRTAIYNDFQYHPVKLTYTELQAPRKIYQLSAWGEALQFRQDKPKIYEFDQASYSTCPPCRMVWQVKASHIELNQITGRGTATNAKVLFKGVPILYTPYINFPIDARRKTGFLWPSIGVKNNYGFYFSAPFYLNMAPNYDMTLTPTYMEKRGIQFIDLFRYLTHSSRGEITGEVLPNDKDFADFQSRKANQSLTDLSPIKISELNRLQNASTTRKALNWQNHTYFNDNWSANLDYNWVSDDYYLRDFSNSLNQITQNQLLQEGDLNYKGPNWNFTGRLQAYQTLHPVDDPNYFWNQYVRFPQLILNGDFPDNRNDIDYFIQNEVTHFDIAHNPGVDTVFPIGNRLYTQPGISKIFNFSFLTITPRAQLSMTQYEVGHISGPISRDPSRVLPIFDLDSSFYFDRGIRFFNRDFKQTLEPRLYYVYIPYKNQNQIPIFDTTVNTLTYDQLFLYNRFSGIDRINDANQLTAGVTTRFIDDQTGTEKLKAAIGEILYFRKRKVTLCSFDNQDLCPPNSIDYPNNATNTRNRSPVAALLNYAINTFWSVNANAIVNPLTNKVENESYQLHYQPPGTQRIFNLGYNYVRQGDVLPGENPNSAASNLSSTDTSINWPLSSEWSFNGRWTQNWNRHHFQNLLYGLQYDSCCWALRLITGRVFTHLSTNETFRYNTQFYIQFALKGLGTVPVTGGDPSQLLSNSISGYQDNFGRDF